MERAGCLQDWFGGALAALGGAVLAVPAAAAGDTLDGQGGDAFQLRGLTFIDAALLQGAATKGRDAQESQLRLAEFGFTYSAGDFTALALYDFARDGAWRDVGIFRARQGLLIAAGQFKEPVSLDKMTLPDGTVMLENALFTSAFGLQRRTGLIAGRYTDHWSVIGAVFLGSLDGTDRQGRGPGQSAASLRTTFTGQAASGRWHAGGWLRRVDYDGAGVVAGSSPNSKLASKTIYADLTGYHGLAQTSVSAGLEAAWSRPGLHLAAEWAAMAFDGANTDGEIGGGYVSASWIVTGEQRDYIKKKGAFRGVVPERPITEGGPGAVEISARIDHLDFDDFGQGAATAWSAGISWTPVDHVRLRTDFTAQRGAGAARGRDSDVLMVRLQLGF